MLKALQKIQAMQELGPVRFACRNKLFPDDNERFLDRIYLVKVNDKRPVNPHKPGWQP